LAYLEEEVVGTSALYRRLWRSASYQLDQMDWITTRMSLAQEGRRVAIKQCQNKDEAQALCNFLWNEGERHKEDLMQIELDLIQLKHFWKVEPVQERSFTKP